MFSLLDTVNVFTVAVVKNTECLCLPRVNDKPCTTAWGETCGGGGETLCLPQEAKGGFYRCGPLCLLYYHPSCVYSWCTRLEKRRSHLLSSWPGLVCNWGGDWERQMSFGGLDYSLLRPRGFMNSLLCQLGASWLSGQSLCSPTDVLMDSLLVTLCSRNKDMSNNWILEANYVLHCIFKCQSCNKLKKLINGVTLLIVLMASKFMYICVHLWAISYQHLSYIFNYAVSLSCWSSYRHCSYL